jgi:hypothetical protein
MAPLWGLWGGFAPDVSRIQRGADMMTIDQMPFTRTPLPRRRYRVLLPALGLAALATSVLSSGHVDAQSAAAYDLSMSGGGTAGIAATYVPPTLCR